MKKFDHYLVRILETHGELVFDSKFAVRICADSSQKRHIEAIERYCSSWRDDRSQVEELNDWRWTGPSGVVVALLNYSPISRELWELIRDENLLHTAVL
jgi:hypothetical protein